MMVMFGVDVITEEDNNNVNYYKPATIIAVHNNNDVYGSYERTRVDLDNECSSNR